MGAAQAMRGPTSVMWNRQFGAERLSIRQRWAACTELEATLRLLGAAQLVVGHTPQVGAQDAGTPATACAFFALPPLPKCYLPLLHPSVQACLFVRLGASVCSSGLSTLCVTQLQPR